MTTIQLTERQIVRRVHSGTYRQDEVGLEKRCGRCHEYFPADLEFFYGNTKKTDGLYSWCKACTAEHRRNKKDRRGISIQKQTTAIAKAEGGVV